MGNDTADSRSQEIIRRYEQEKRLRESILSTVPDYIHVYNIRTQSFSYYNEGQSFFGHDLIHAEDPVELVVRQVHPEDMAEAGYAYLERIAKHTGEEILNFEFRIRRRDGSWRWALTRARPFSFGPDGGLEEVITVTQDITEKKEQQAAYQQSQRMLHMAVEGAKLGIWEWDIEHKLVTYSNRFLEQLGYDPALFSNRYDDFEKLLHPEDIPRLNREFREQTARGDRYELDYRLLAKCGRYHWVYDRGQAVQRNQKGEVIRAIGISIDITQRKEAEIALKESEALQDAILNALPDLKFRISVDGVFLDYFASPGENDKLFAAPDQFLGKPVQDVMPEYLYKAVRKNLQAAIESGSTQSFEYPLMVDGEICYFEARISPVNQDEAIAVVRDISALKRAQQALQDKVRELDQNNQKLNEYVDSNIQLENFAHTVSHDLREPVRTINSFAQLLQKKYHGQLDKDADVFLDFIASSASNMNTLIEDLLKYSRFNQSRHETEEIPLEQLLHDVASALSGLIAERRATVYACTPLPTVRGNWTKASQLFQNLISNAIKFGREAEAPVVEVFAFEQPDRWAFAIRDNGIGIDAEYQQQIFLLFRRLHSKRYYPGSGIGLALCKRIVEQHGGEIWVESLPGRGSTFYFTLSKSQ